MKPGEFVQLVAKMRKAQKAYFRERNNLDECKQLEKAVDRAIEEITRPPDLFGKQENGE